MPHLFQPRDQVAAGHYVSVALFVFEPEVRLSLNQGSVDGQVLNLGGGERVSVNELAAMILKLMDSSLEVEHAPSAAGDARDTWADTTKAKELLGWRPEVSLEEGLKRFIDWYVPIADEIREIVD